MDNLQVRLTDRDKEMMTMGWIAGMIDADGCIGFQSRQRRGRTTREPYIDIASIVPAAIEMLVKSLNSLGLTCFVNKSSGTCRAIRISGINRCGRALARLKSCIFIKRIEAEATYQWCKSRQANKENLLFTKGETKCSKPNSGYTDKEEELVALVKHMKSDRNLRDYMPDPCWIMQDEEIVRTCVRAQDSGRNDLSTPMGEVTD